VPADHWGIRGALIGLPGMPTAKDFGAFFSFFFFLFGIHDWLTRNASGFR